MDDLISRQQAIDAAKHAWAKGLEPSQYIELLPSAQPKWPETAKRIVGHSRNGITMWYECDRCGQPVDQGDCYCSSCGRRLEDG